MKWILRDGQTIQVLEDHWISSSPLRSLIKGPLMPNEDQRLVISLRDNHIWRLEDLQFPLPMQLEQFIKSIILVVQLTRLSSSFVWAHNNGVCSISSTSKFLYQRANVPFNNSIWCWI